MWTTTVEDILVTGLKMVGWGLTTAGGAFIGSYLGSYMKKKGENKAIHEDIGKLVDQVKAVTEATKKIEATISDEVWNRQKRWEIKREVLFEVVRNVSRSYDVLKHLDLVLQTGIANSSSTSPFLMQLKVEENAKWFEAVSALDQSGLFIDATCDKRIGAALFDYRKLAAIAGKIHKDDAQIFKSKNVDLMRLRNALLDAIRKDLGIDVTPQSIES
jgi:hypothetical protein